MPMHDPLKPSYIMLPTGGYFYGVEARGKGWDSVELHGGFKTRGTAEVYRINLLTEYDDYDYAKVVKIELPEA
jgi:hypothetical protein